MLKTAQEPNSISPLESIKNQWVRLPKAGPSYRFWGLSRTTLTELALTGAIRSTLIKKRGAERGIRLIFLPSLQDYLFRQSKQGSNGGNGDRS